MQEVLVTTAMGDSVLVYDVGGSHVSAAVCFAGTYRLGPVVSAMHPAEQSSDAFVQILHSLGVEASAGICGVSGAELAVPGPFDFATGVSLMRHKLPYLYGVDLRQKLAGRFGWEPEQVRFLLDAAAFLLGEMAAGSARGISCVAGITLGTGVGSALAVDGRLLSEGPGIPPGGEIWNLPFEGGIVEDSVSSRAIRGIYQRLTGEERDVAELAALAPSDQAATKSFAEFGHDIGRALRTTLADFAPEVIVLGGGISRASRLFIPAARLEMKGSGSRLLVSTLMDNAALLGAGAAWFNGVNDPLPASAAIAGHSDVL
jgi:glucokinase